MDASRASVPGEGLRQKWHQVYPSKKPEPNGNNGLFVFREPVSSPFARYRQKQENRASLNRKHVMNRRIFMRSNKYPSAIGPVGCLALGLLLLASTPLSWEQPTTV